ncbi:stathmin-1-A-like [Uloborus diversus]|uniref:stathmin-1-A-like n=1 Tax=Uloborus diversus TaxID=327109 RepID=UPI002409C070|nr:stathmin-1-A-like [Uloborus diversus]
MCDSAETVRATETAKGGIKYELVLSEPSVNDPPKKDQITSPPKTMSVEEIEQKLKAAEERRLMLEAERLNQINEKKNKLQEASQKRQEFNNNFIQSTKESLEQKMETFENNREAKLKALQEKLKEHERHIEEVRQSKNLNPPEANEECPVASSG